MLETSVRRLLCYTDASNSAANRGRLRRRDFLQDVYKRQRVHKAVVSRAVLDEVCDRLRSCTLEQRKQVVGLDPGRAPVIVAGLVILQEVLDLAEARSFTVSETDILHGMILDAADR